MRNKVIFAFILAIFLISDCKAVNIQSQIKTAAVTIDGNAEEWSSSRVFCREEKLILGFQHDAENLYVLLISRDPELERLMLTQGFTLWLNDQGKRKKNLGLTVPGMRRETAPKRENLKPELDQFQKRGNTFDEQFQKKIELPPQFLYLLEKKEDPLPVNLSELMGFEYARKYSEEGVVYEFKIPLAKAGEQIFGYSPEKGEYISLGLECKVEKKETERMGMGFEPGSGGMPGGGGDDEQGTGRGGMGKPEGEKMPPASMQEKDYLIWMKIGI
jgi:hypothetical protein